MTERTSRPDPSTEAARSRTSLLTNDSTAADTASEEVTCDYCLARGFRWAVDHHPDQCIRKELRYVPGGSFILDYSESGSEPLWGRGKDVLHAQGEALIIAGRQGTGKTTLAQQYALAHCRVEEYAELLGYPVNPKGGKVLYLAMDRPRQAARSFKRMVGTSWRRELDNRLVVWEGPPPMDLAKNPSMLLRLAENSDWVGADLVIVDSLKDAAVGLSDEEVAGGYNRARQRLLAAGVDIVEVHHTRKRPHGATGRPDIDDLFGSTWLTSGAGSVLLLSGAPGDPIVDLHHLKQPENEVGPLRVIHDHTDGRSTVWHEVDLVKMAHAATDGITVVDAARAMFETAKPEQRETEKARRRLENLVGSGKLIKRPGSVGGNEKNPTRYLGLPGGAFGCG